MYTLYTWNLRAMWQEKREPQGIGPADGEDWGATGILK